MNKLLVALGRSFGLIGIAVCVVAIVARAAGFYWLGSVSSGAALQGGVAALIIAVLCFVAR